MHDKRAGAYFERPNYPGITEAATTGPADVKDTTPKKQFSWPVAVSLPQLSVGALDALTNSFFYCNFTLEAFAAHVAFGHATHFFRQPLAFLCGAKQRWNTPLYPRA